MFSRWIEGDAAAHDLRIPLVGQVKGDMTPGKCPLQTRRWRSCGGRPGDMLISVSRQFDRPPVPKPLLLLPLTAHPLTALPLTALPLTTLPLTTSHKSSFTASSAPKSTAAHPCAIAAAVSPTPLCVGGASLGGTTQVHGAQKASVSSKFRAAVCGSAPPRESRALGRNSETFPPS